MLSGGGGFGTTASRQSTSSSRNVLTLWLYRFCQILWYPALVDLRRKEFKLQLLGNWFAALVILCFTDIFLVCFVFNVDRHRVEPKRIRRHFFPLYCYFVLLVPRQKANWKAFKRRREKEKQRPPSLPPACLPAASTRTPLCVQNVINLQLLSRRRRCLSVKVESDESFWLTAFEELASLAAEEPAPMVVSCSQTAE